MSLCDKCIHRDVCGNEDAREEAVKVCDDFIDKSILSIPDREKGTPKAYFVDSAVSKNCKNLSESYGEICVKCNKCGRFER